MGQAGKTAARLTAALLGPPLIGWECISASLNTFAFISTWLDSFPEQGNKKKQSRGKSALPGIFPLEKDVDVQLLLSKKTNSELKTLFKTPLKTPIQHLACNIGKFV